MLEQLDKNRKTIQGALPLAAGKVEFSLWDNPSRTISTKNLLPLTGFCQREPKPELSVVNEFHYLNTLRARHRSIFVE